MDITLANDDPTERNVIFCSVNDANERDTGLRELLELLQFISELLGHIQ